jgi:hypothetical protein
VQDLAINFSSFVKKKKAPEAPPSVSRSLIVFLKDLQRVRIRGGDREEDARDVVVVIDSGTVTDLSKVEGLILHELNRHITIALQREEGRQHTRPSEDGLDILPIPSMPCATGEPGREEREEERGGSTYVDAIGIRFSNSF